VGGAVGGAGAFVGGGLVGGGFVAGGAVTWAVVGTNAVAGVVVGAAVVTGTDVMTVIGEIDGGGLSKFRPSPHAASTATSAAKPASVRARDTLLIEFDAKRTNARTGGTPSRAHGQLGRIVMLPLSVDV
jgi:hypothetical protein